MIEKLILGTGVSFTLKGKKIRGVVCGERVNAQPQYFTIIHILNPSDANFVEGFCVGRANQAESNLQLHYVGSKTEIFSYPSNEVDPKYWKSFIPYEKFESIKFNCFYVPLGELTLRDEDKDDEIYNLIQEINFELNK